MAAPAAEGNGNPTYEDANGDGSDVEVSNPKGGRKPPKLGQAVQRRQPSSGTNGAPQQEQQQQMSQELAPPAQQEQQLPPQGRGGGRIVPVHQSRITDRPPKKDDKDSSLKIKIELDLEVEVELYARVKGDVTIGLM